MTQPKEIWVTKNDAEFLMLPLGIEGLQGLITTSNVGNQVKYLSEEHFNSLIEEKDKEIEKAHKHIRLLLATMDGELEANREEYGESYIEHYTSINAKEYLKNYKK